MCIRDSNGTGELDLSQLSSSNKFTIHVSSLTLSNSGTGQVYDTEANANYKWTIATFGSVKTNTTEGFSSSQFTVDTTGSSFANNTTFNLAVNLDSLNHTLYLAPVPEPTSILAVSAAAAGLAGFIRRRRKAKAAATIAA